MLLIESQIEIVNGLGNKGLFDDSERSRIWTLEQNSWSEDLEAKCSDDQPKVPTNKPAWGVASNPDEVTDKITHAYAWGKEK